MTYKKCLSEICKDIGVDYLSLVNLYLIEVVCMKKLKKNTITKSEINQKVLSLKKYETNNFKILFREHQFESESLDWV